MFDHQNIRQSIETRCRIGELKSPAIHSFEWTDIAGFSLEDQGESVCSAREFVQDVLLSPVPASSPSHRIRPWWKATGAVGQSIRAVSVGMGMASLTWSRETGEFADYLYGESPYK